MVFTAEMEASERRVGDDDRRASFGGEFFKEWCAERAH